MTVSSWAPGVDQMGFVVSDIEESMAYWAEVLGVGPWFYLRRSATRNLYFRGEKTPVVSSTALAQAGGVQVELIQLRNDVPSAYRDMNPHGPGALHHLGYFVEDYQAALAARQADGLEVVQNGDVGPAIRFCYLADPRRSGLLVELIEIGSLRPFFTQIADAAKRWDGTEPIREIKPAL
jgi:catechol 2,3-dioxygenase-like lactoylglutathione lyase family enzyme